MTGLETATIAMIMAGAGTAISAVGAIASGNATKKASEYNAKVGEINANAAVEDAAENARRQRRLNAKATGTIRNKEGYSMDVLEDNVREGELMALDLIHQGDVKAAGLRSGAILDRMQGKAAQTAGYVGAAGTLLKGGASAYGSLGGATTMTSAQSAAAGGFGTSRLGEFG